MTQLPLFADALSLGLATTAQSANLRDCDTFEANARNLSYPYEQATKTYAEGAISLLNLFLDEPACCGAHLMVLFPAGDEGFLDCQLISHEDQLGYASLSLANASASYDAARGLIISVPSQIDVDGELLSGRLLIAVNQQQGTIEVRDQ